MKKGIIIGGGLAGLSAASFLSSQNIPVTVLEASPRLGGRTNSFKDSFSGEFVDNGQHILMGCYEDSLSLIELVKAQDNFIYQDNLKINFLTDNKKEYLLSAASLLYPLNFLYAIINYDILSSKDKLSLIGFLIRIPFISKRSIADLTLFAWLEKENQNENIRKALWEILCVGALNTDIYQASALIFYEIIIKIFFNGNFASTIILPKYDLDSSIIKPVVEYVVSKQSEIKVSEKVNEIEIKNNRIIKIESSLANYCEFDFVISSVPHYSLKKIVDTKDIAEAEFEYSTILNIHLWLNNNPFEEKFYGLINSKIHWIFNKGSHINLVISNAEEFVDRNNEDVFQIVLKELKQYTGINENDIVRYKIIKEKRATFIPNKNVLHKRPIGKTNIKNFYLAGDWTDTKLPSTIESAVRSGKLAAELVLNDLKI